MEISNIIRTLPFRYSKNETENALNKYNDWFYSYSFANGASTVAINNQVEQVHQSRASLIFPFLDEQYSGRWNSVTCCDIACHQGWFAAQVALRGAKKVTGVDARAEHIQMAEEIKKLSGIANISFQQGDLFNCNPKKTGTFTITLFLGILYHLDNPMGALRVVRSITESLCVIETQVIREDKTIECTWGCESWQRSGPAMVVVPSDECHVCGTAVTFVPSIKALYAMLYAAGFSRLYHCIPHESVNEQYRNYERVILFAYV